MRKYRIYLGFEKFPALQPNVFQLIISRGAHHLEHILDMILSKSAIFPRSSRNISRSLAFSKIIFYYFLAFKMELV
jgi:hypothetical protein